MNNSKESLEESNYDEIRDIIKEIGFNYKLKLLENEYSINNDKNNVIIGIEAEEYTISLIKFNVFKKRILDVYLKQCCVHIPLYRDHKTLFYLSEKGDQTIKELVNMINKIVEEEFEQTKQTN